MASRHAFRDVTAHVQFFQENLFILLFFHIHLISHPSLPLSVRKGSQVLEIWVKPNSDKVSFGVGRGAGGCSNPPRRVGLYGDNLKRQTSKKPRAHAPATELCRFVCTCVCEYVCPYLVYSLTRLDSSGEARLSKRTLTFTVRVKESETNVHHYHQ
ncbi:hypothetical protein RUM43_000580 [Polyplax serrata]|uniref:Uncharacterized protein n=1 Tax=Polyplax serrata TaxID=468196 RepID=A0AAN8SCM7_POLSC